jgi:hypothetical protein
MLSQISPYAVCRDAECECNDAVCHKYKAILLSDVMLSVNMPSATNKTILLSVEMLNVIMLCVVMLNVVILNVVMLLLSDVTLNVKMLSVIILNVVAPKEPKISCSSSKHQKMFFSKYKLIRLRPHVIKLFTLVIYRCGEESYSCWIMIQCDGFHDYLIGSATLGRKTFGRLTFV